MIKDLVSPEKRLGGNIYKHIWLNKPLTNFYFSVRAKCEKGDRKNA